MEGINLAYIAIFFCTIIILLGANRAVLTNICFCISAIIATIEDLINHETFTLLAFLNVTMKINNSFKINKAINLIWALLSVATIFVIYATKISTSILIIDGLRLSDFSNPFSMRSNVGHALCALVVYLNSSIFRKERYINTKSITIVLTSLLTCVSLLILIGLSMDYVQFEPKLPDIFITFAFHNFLFNCLTEEVFFRGVLQNICKNATEKLFGKRTFWQYTHIFLISLIFAFAHSKYVGSYMFLAFLCSICYGYVYHKTNNILCAILTHWSINVVHILIFRYPY